jgi:hypothetical protein
MCSCPRSLASGNLSQIGTGLPNRHPAQVDLARAPCGLAALRISRDEVTAMVKTASTATAHWRARLRDLLHDCVASGPSEQALRLSEACHLLTGGSDAARVDAMLRAGAFESAALAVMGEGVGYMLSRGATGAALASVVLPDSDEEATAEAETPALALIAAHLAALLDGDERERTLGSHIAAAASARLN